MKEELKEKYEQAKQHVKDHREGYLAGAAGLVAGAAVAIVVTDKSGISQKISGLIVWKPEQTIISLVDPGDLILVKETGEKYRSKNLAARALGVDRHELYNLTLGETRRLRDAWTITNVGKAQTG